MTEEHTSGGMTFDRFAAIVEAYGADETRWPEAERDAANAFLLRSPEAASLLSDARALDHILDAAPEATISDAFVARILGSVPQPDRALVVAPAPRGLVDRLGDLVAVLWPQQGVIRPAALVLGSLTVGFFVGLNTMTATAAAEPENSADLVAYVFGAPAGGDWISEDWNEGEAE